MLYDAYNNMDNFNYSSSYVPDDNSVRMAKRGDELSDFSSQSILCAMDRFVKAVNNMNETVMVPSRLLDVDVESSAPPALLKGSSNAYTCYSMLNTVKNDLIWGPPTADEDDEEEEDPAHRQAAFKTSWSQDAPDVPIAPPSTTTKDKMRRQSSLSMISVGSSDAEDAATSSDASVDGDSGVDGSSEGGEDASALTASMRGHLVGLHRCLASLTHTAAYITDRYQDEVNL